jgi:hypothetical protein
MGCTLSNLCSKDYRMEKDLVSFVYDALLDLPSVFIGENKVGVAFSFNLTLTPHQIPICHLGFYSGVRSEFFTEVGLSKRPTLASNLFVVQAGIGKDAFVMWEGAKLLGVTSVIIDSDGKKGTYVKIECVKELYDHYRNIFKDQKWVLINPFCGGTFVLGEFGRYNKDGN